MRTHTARSGIVRMIRRLERILDTTECGILVPDAHWAPTERPGPSLLRRAIYPAIVDFCQRVLGHCVEAAVELPRGEKPYAVVP